MLQNIEHASIACKTQSTNNGWEWNKPTPTIATRNAQRWHVWLKSWKIVAINLCKQLSLVWAFNILLHPFVSGVLYMGPLSILNLKSSLSSILLTLLLLIRCRKHKIITRFVCYKCISWHKIKMKLKIKYCIMACSPMAT